MGARACLYFWNAADQYHPPFETRDVDAGLAAAGSEAQDWQGGTRIGGCLHAFNRDWTRRVMGQGAVVMLITDGLDRDPDHDLGREMQRLHLSSKRLIWLKSAFALGRIYATGHGHQIYVPHVDSFRASHSISSLEDLANVIFKPQ